MSCPACEVYKEWIENLRHELEDEKVAHRKLQETYFKYTGVIRENGSRPPQPDLIRRSGLDWKTEKIRLEKEAINKEAKEVLGYWNKKKEMQDGKERQASTESTESSSDA